ncbi:MAG: lipase maturation factor family protein [Bryobacteraceae bacterium]
MTGASAIFVRALGAIYLIAFLSFGVQAPGLIGSQGILPISSYLRSAHAALGARAFWYEPTIFWFNSSDLAFGAAWIAGAAMAILLMLGLFRRTCLIGMLVLYLSISVAGQDFWSFQWDILLTEAGFLAIFADGTPGRTWLFRWLLFRLIFMSGMVKLLSGDPTWRDLTALGYHYLTQPLPTPIAWYMDQLPAWFQKASTAFVFFVEVVVPFAIFASIKLRRMAGILLIGLQVLILLTGNYTFFNWLTIALCVFLFVDRPAPATRPETRTHRVVTLALMVFVLTSSGIELLDMFRAPIPAPVRSYMSWISPPRLVNSYGLFAVMTTTRLEIVIEGSNDGDHWMPYEFRYKPGDVRRAPPWVAPYQPRLDWQMWFAALGSAQENPWFYSFAARLLQGSAPVLGLLEHNPFPVSPPRYIRALIYDYRFTNFAERRRTGAWWQREQKGVYLPVISLKRE